MLQITLRRNDAPSYRTATIDFPAREDLLAAELERIGIGIGSEKNCLVDKIDGDGRALFHLVGNCVNADEVQYLAKRMDSFGKDELAIFRSAVMAEDFPEVKDLINLTFNLHCYTVITDFSDVGSIGYAYLMSKEGCLPCNGQTNMHFVAAGRDLIASGGGVVTPFGVLYHNGNQPEMVYNGKQFPEYLYKDCVATVTLSPNEGGSPAETLYFPCFDVEIKKALLRHCHLG